MGFVVFRLRVANGKQAVATGQPVEEGVHAISKGARVRQSHSGTLGIRRSLAIILAGRQRWGERRAKSRPRACSASPCCSGRPIRVQPGFGPAEDLVKALWHPNKRASTFTTRTA